MASAPLPPPESVDERLERHDRAWTVRRRRERLVPWLTLLLAILIHLAGALFGVWWARRAPALEPEPPTRARLRFVPPQPEAEPAPQPVESDQISERDVEAMAPEPSVDPPPLFEPPPSPPVRERRPEPPPPEPEPAPEESIQLSPEQKRERVRELLCDWSSPTQSREPYESMPQVPPDALRGGPDIQFESSADVDWGPYAERIKRIVRSNWRIPTIAQVGGKGASQLHFYIACDGSVEELELVTASGTLPLDVSAENAIALSNRLPPPPLPPEYCEERVGITWSFFYNMDERDLRTWYRDRAVAQRRALTAR